MQCVAVEDSKSYNNDNITQVTSPNKGNEHTTVPSGTVPISKIDLGRLLPATNPASAMIENPTTPTKQRVSIIYGAG